MLDLDSPEFKSAVREIVRSVLRGEINDYVENNSILPIKIQGSDRNGVEAGGGDVLQYNATEQIMEVAP